MKIDEYKYLTGEEIIPSGQSQMTKHVKFGKTDKEISWCFKGFKIIDGLKQIEKLMIRLLMN